MEFELAADVDALAGLGRLKSLSASRDGRPRPQSIKIVWHDSPEHALLADGLTLAEQRGVWRLERVLPGADTWLPAQPPPVVAEAPDPSTLPSPLAPLAAFDGRRTSSVHRLGDSAITLAVDRGTLRSVTAEHQAARVCVSGDEAAVHAAIQLIAGAIPVTVPLASLAEEAIALATGRKPQFRHEGAPVLPDSIAAPADALAHIIGHMTDVILSHAPLAAGPDETGIEAVHQMRVAVRRARSALSVFRPVVEPAAFTAVNDRFRTLGAQLAPVRDWDVFVEETMLAIQGAFPGDHRIERLAVAAARRRQEHRAALNTYLGSRAFRELGIELAWFSAATGWHIPLAGEDLEPLSLSAFSATVLQERWKKLISAGKRMDQLDVPALHGVRLRAKRARYAAEMFATLHRGKAAHRFIRRLSVLQQRLGVLNDGAVATHLLQELGGPSGRHAYAVGVVAGFIAARSGRIRPRIIAAFEKFRRQPTYWT